MSHGSISHQFDIWMDDGMDRKWNTGDIDGRHVKHFIVAWMTLSVELVCGNDNEDQQQDAKCSESDAHQQ